MSELLCPKCGSNQLSANKKGFSGKKAVVGAVLTGGIGLLAGTLGSNKIKITCLSCGHVFSPGQGAKSQEELKQKNELPTAKGCLIMLGLLMALVLFLKYGLNPTANLIGGEKADADSKRSPSLDTFLSAEADIDRILSLSDIKGASKVPSMSKIKNLNKDSLFQIYLTRDDEKKRMEYADSLKAFVKPTRDTLDKMWTAELNKERLASDKKYENSKAGRIQKKHPEWSESDCERVANNTIWIGMTIDMLRYERGKPNSATPSNYGDGINWQWCWDNYTPSCFYGKEDGIITSYN